MRIRTPAALLAGIVLGFVAASLATEPWEEARVGFAPPDRTADGLDIPWRFSFAGLLFLQAASTAAATAGLLGTAAWGRRRGRPATALLFTAAGLCTPAWFAFMGGADHAEVVMGVATSLSLSWFAFAHGDAATRAAAATAHVVALAAFVVATNLYTMQGLTWAMAGSLVLLGVAWVLQTRAPHAPGPRWLPAAASAGWLLLATVLAWRDVEGTGGEGRVALLTAGAGALALTTGFLVRRTWSGAPAAPAAPAAPPPA